ncbi:MAG: hypothetical protein K2J77_04885 [Oscillospiraceae bacterium]|nr:hypothetical protein [Oscillospiraceae bacterium]
MTAFDKLKAALGSYKIVRKFEEKLLLGSLKLDGGRLDIRRYRVAELPRSIENIPCVILFPNTENPPIKCGFLQMSRCLSEIAAVSHYALIVLVNRAEIIEIYRGEITIVTPR